MAEEKPYPKRFEIDESVDQNDIDLCAKVSPEHKDRVLRLIKSSLGYLPPRQIYLPHLAFRQSLDTNYEKGIIPDSVYAREALANTKRIRNDDMRKGGWLRYLKYGEDHYEFYHSFLSLYKEAARERLHYFMGYEPSLDYSLEAEVYLRQLFESDTHYASMPICDVDLKAITIIRYREAFILEGEEVANNSAVMGLIYDELIEKAKKNM